MIVRFEFHGGFRDGEVLVGTDDVQNVTNPCRRYLILSDSGRIGAWFRETPPAGADWRKIAETMKDKFGSRIPEPKQEEFVKAFLGTPLLWHRYQVTERTDDSDGITIQVSLSDYGIG